MADWQSRRRLLTAKLSARLGRDGVDPVALRIRGPAALEVFVRPGTSDMGILYEHFARGAHLPPGAEPMRQIIELGTGSELALADLARRYPGARLLGVEPDRENAEMARLNTEPFGDPCSVLEAAVWDVDADLVIEGQLTGLLVVRPASEDERGSAVRGLSMEGLLSEQMPHDPIDFLHVDIAGVEPRVFTPGVRWMQRMRSITIQVYPDRGLTQDQCVELLHGYGFVTRPDVAWWGGQVFGVRDG